MLVSMASTPDPSGLESPSVESFSAGTDPDPVLERTPIEDAGAATARWYTFQYATAVRYCLDMVRPISRAEWVLCEWHTDYVVGWQDNTYTLVSVKYREPDSGIWTVPRLFSDGGLATFMKRWNECNRPSECRWMTNGGLDLECRALRDKCASSRINDMGTISAELASRFDQPANDVAQFLSALRIDNTCPKVEHIRILDIDRHARTVLRELEMAIESAPDAYDAVTQIVRSAAQGFGESPGPWLLAAPGVLDAGWILKTSVAQRLITREHVMNALRSAAVPAAASLPTLTQPVTRLIAKLKAGEIIPSAMAAARRARRAWTEYEHGLSCPLPGTPIGPDFAGLRALLTAEAAEAQLSASRKEAAYGNEMLAGMLDRVASVAREQMGAYGLDSRLLMGLVYDLTAHCEIWWSAEFDIEDLAS